MLDRYLKSAEGSDAAINEIRSGGNPLLNRIAAISVLVGAAISCSGEAGAPEDFNDSEANVYSTLPVQTDLPFISEDETSSDMQAPDFYYEEVEDLEPLGTIDAGMPEYRPDVSPDAGQE